MSFPKLCFFTLCACAAAGDFPIEVPTFYSTPPANSIAIGPEGVVYAGTTQGLRAFRNGAWVAESNAPVEAVAANTTAVAYLSNGKLHLKRGRAPWSERRLPVPPNSVLALNGTEPFIRPRSVAISGKGHIAQATENSLVENGHSLFPHQNSHSWAPRDVRAVAYDAQGNLHFASPQGVGIREPSGWKLYTTGDGLPYDDFTAIAPASDGSVWYGTRMGAIHFDGKTWEYRQGLRWLPADDVRAIAVSGTTAWFATSAGIGRIEQQHTTFARKARFFEEQIDRLHRRTEYGYVLGVRVPTPGDPSGFTQHDSDNDGLWTSMYGAGECFACAATGDEQACRRATAAFEALRFLGAVTQGGPHPAPPGFVARSILPTTGRDPNLSDSPQRDQRARASDPLWKVMNPRWPVSADRKWYWKADTSSDELDGHYFFYALYYDLAAKTAERKRRVSEHVAALTDHLIDHDFKLVDYDGKVTRWGVFDPADLNHSPHWYGDRSLNSTSILSYLKVAEHITGNTKYARAARMLIDQHGYAMNTLIPKDAAGPGAGNQSDDEMAFMCFYNLMKYETHPVLRRMYGAALRTRWEMERPELCPLFNFIAGEGIEDGLETLRRFPLDRFNWALKNSHRKDLVLWPGGRGHRRNGLVLPIDERYVDQWNHDPWRLDYQGDGRYLADGAAYLLPYYMGLYLKLLE